MIRDAILDDIPKLLEMGVLMHSEGRFKRFNFDLDKLEVVLDHLIEDKRGIALVCDDDGITGLFIGVVVEHYFGRDLSSMDLALYVDKEHRKGKTAMLLIEEYKKQAIEKGAVDVGIGNSMGEVGDLYLKAGFTLVGGNYRMEA